MKESGWGRSVFYFTAQQVRMLKWNFWLKCHHFESEIEIISLRKSVEKTVRITFSYFF